MNILQAAMMAISLMLAGMAHAEEPTQKERHVVGLICKNARDLTNLVRLPTWTQPAPDPKLAVRQVKRAAHDPDACEFSVQPYVGKPEQVNRIVRQPGEVYRVIRFALPNDPANPHGPQHRYVLLNGE